MSIIQNIYYEPSLTEVRPTIRHNRDLLSKAMPFLDKVVKAMGAVELGRFSFDSNPYPSAGIDHENQIYISIDLLNALLRRNDAYSTPEVMGVLAHEIGHRISKDWEEAHKKILESAGCQVESFTDIAELYQHLDQLGYRLPKKASAKRLAEDFIEYGVKEDAKKESKLKSHRYPSFLNSMQKLMLHSGGRSYDPQIDDYKEENYKSALESIGCKIELWEDISEFRSAFWQDFKILPEKESAKHLCLAFLNYHNNYVEKNIKKKIVMDIDWKQIMTNLENDFKKNHLEWYRDGERRADLHTMRDPALARGLRDYFLRELTNCKANLACSSVEEGSSSHPSFISRITYMTQALCKNYPEENRDICPDARLPHNATCPSSHRFKPNDLLSI